MNFQPTAAKPILYAKTPVRVPSCPPLKLIIHDALTDLRNDHMRCEVQTGTSTEYSYQGSAVSEIKDYIISSHGQPNTDSFDQLLVKELERGAGGLWVVRNVPVGAGSGDFEVRYEVLVKRQDPRSGRVFRRARDGRSRVPEPVQDDMVAVMERWRMRGGNGEGEGTRA